jgi:poly(3-hydroxybutyrate) depolymerase
VRRAWDGCEAQTVLYIVENGGHAWPGRPQPGFEDAFGHGTVDVDASALLFEMFLGPPA